jgi:hypothetical protein
MTEAEWLSSTDPDALLTFLIDKVTEAGRFSCTCCQARCRRHSGLCPVYRKLRLFACACCRRVLHLLPHPSCAEALSAVEQFIEGRVDPDAYARASAEFDAVRRGQYPKTVSPPDDDAWVALYGAVHRKWSNPFDGSDRSNLRWELAARVAGLAALATWREESRMETNWRSPTDAEIATAKREQPEYAAQCQLLRDIFGNLFRTVRIDAGWLAWNGATVPKIAQTIYDDRAFDRLPVLADALEDSGCNHPDLLTHLRSGRDHVCGCWALDLLLGKT